MNEKERFGCIELLRKLPATDLKGLHQTVTKNILPSVEKNELIEAIIVCSVSAEELLLKRQKIKRDFLLQYLVGNSVPILIKSEKITIVQKIIEYWNSKDNLLANNQTVVQAANNEPQHKHGDGVQHVGASNNSAAQHHQNHFVQQNFNTQYVQHVHQTQFIQMNQQTHEEPQVPPPHENKEVQCIGETFVKWFYEIWNSQNPTMQSEPQYFGADHFWNDCRLQLTSQTPDPSNEEFADSHLTSERLLALTKTEQLLFNPNLSKEGIYVKMNPHGLLMILICGTLHRGQDCLGVFEQVFGLLRDPRFDNNWKIKMSKLKLTSSQVTAMPALTGLSNDYVQALVSI